MRCSTCPPITTRLPRNSTTIFLFPSARDRCACKLNPGRHYRCSTIQSFQTFPFGSFPELTPICYGHPIGKLCMTQVGDTKGSRSHPKKSKIDIEEV